MALIRVKDSIAHPSRGRKSPISESHELDESRIVTVIGLLERIHIFGAKLLGFDLECRTPSEPLSSKSENQVVGCDTSVATISIRERVDVDQAMMKSSRELIRSENTGLNPDPGVGSEIPNRPWDLCGRDADVRFA